MQAGSGATAPRPATASLLCVPAGASPAEQGRSGPGSVRRSRVTPGPGRCRNPVRHFALRWDRSTELPLFEQGPGSWHTPVHALDPMAAQLAPTCSVLADMGRRCRAGRSPWSASARFVLPGQWQFSSPPAASSHHPDPPSPADQCAQPSSTRPHPNDAPRMSTTASAPSPPNLTPKCSSAVSPTPGARPHRHGRTQSSCWNRVARWWRVEPMAEAGHVFKMLCSLATHTELGHIRWEEESPGGCYVWEGSEASVVLESVDRDDDYPIRFRVVDRDLRSVGPWVTDVLSETNEKEWDDQVRKLWSLVHGRPGPIASLLKDLDGLS